MANVHYPHLFTPITVRGKRIKNRIASAPHCGPNMFRCGENGYSNFTETAVQYFGALAMRFLMRLPRTVMCVNKCG